MHVQNVQNYCFSLSKMQICDLSSLSLNKRTATWNVFVLYNKELKDTEKAFLFQISPL